MIESIQDLITCLEAVIPHKFYRVWCDLHQLDLIMKYVYKELMDDEFNDILHKLIDYL